MTRTGGWLRCPAVVAPHPVELVSHVRVHRRQFVIGPRPLRARSDWQTRELGPGVVLSHCPTLPIEETDGLVLGIALRSARAREGWAGRWAFVSEDLRLELDASGVLGCFYRDIGDAIWVSSSASILREIEPRLPFVEPLLIPAPWGTGSYPLPRCGVVSRREAAPVAGAAPGLGGDRASTRSCPSDRNSPSGGRSRSSRRSSSVS